MKQYIPLKDVVQWEETRNIRDTRNPLVIQEYAENIEDCPPIVLDQHNRLLDGFHRYEAHQIAGCDKIAYKIHEVKTDANAVECAIRFNAGHGIPLTKEERQRNAIRLCRLGYTNVKIAKILKRHPTVIGKYVKEVKDQDEKELAMKTGSLYETRDEEGKRIYSHVSLGKELNISRSQVDRLLRLYKELTAPEEETDEEVPTDDTGFLTSLHEEENGEDSSEDENEDESEDESEDEDDSEDESEEVREVPKPFSTSPDPLPVSPPVKGTVTSSRYNNVVSTNDIEGYDDEHDDEYDVDDEHDDEHDVDDEKPYGDFSPSYNSSQVDDDIDIVHADQFLDDCTRIDAADFGINDKKVKAIARDEDGLFWFYEGDNLEEFLFADGFEEFYTL